MIFMLDFAPLLFGIVGALIGSQRDYLAFWSEASGNGK